MIRTTLIAALGFILPVGFVAGLLLGWTSPALADEISYSFKVRLEQPFGNLKQGKILTGSWTVDTEEVDIPVSFTKIGFFEVTRFQVVDPQNGGTWTDVFSDPAAGAAIVGDNITAFLIDTGRGRLKHLCPEDSECDAYVVGFDGVNSQVSGTFAGVTSITEPLDGAGGLTLADLGFGIVFEGSELVLKDTAHPTGDAFFSEMLLFSGGFYKDGEVGKKDFQGEPFATIDRVSISLTPTPSICPSPVLLDIKPGSFPNNINLKSKNVILVAILTTEDFDATTVNPASVRFGPGDATVKHGVDHVEDVDSDGDADIVYHFPTQDSGIQCGDTTATLTGTTFGGQQVTGSDSIVTQGCQ